MPQSINLKIYVQFEVFTYGTTKQNLISDPGDPMLSDEPYRKGSYTVHVHTHKHSGIYLYKVKFTI